MINLAITFVFMFVASLPCINLFAAEKDEHILTYYTVETNGRIAKILKQGNTYTFADEFGKVSEKTEVDEKGNFVAWGIPGHMYDNGRIIYWHGNRWLRKSSQSSRDLNYMGRLAKEHFKLKELNPDNDKQMERIKRLVKQDMERALRQPERTDPTEKQRPEDSARGGGKSKGGGGPRGGNKMGNPGNFDK